MAGPLTPVADGRLTHDPQFNAKSHFGLVGVAPVDELDPPVTGGDELHADGAIALWSSAPRWSEHPSASPCARIVDVHNSWGASLRILDFESATQDVYDFFFDVNEHLIYRG
jgi:hypothetical protein